jgi:Fur family peroxide stress response transcriptional regulator
MDETAKRERIELFKQLCREQGERSTVQRRVILEAILELDDHPTADQVHNAVRERLPGIAKPTVYRALEHLARMGVITKACHPGRVVRYDSRVDRHHHLVCLHCNQFVDFEDEALDNLEIPDTSDVGFEVSDFRVQLRGVCSSCQQNARREDSK